MIINEIELKDFRNHSNLTLSFSNRANFIVGPNGTGKTNIIEAISVLSNLRSFRNIHDTELVRWGSNYYYCSSTLSRSEYTKFEVAYSTENHNYRKRIKIDDVTLHNSIDYYGKLLTVVFAPSDIQLIQGTPDIKRRFFDSVISKIDNSYMSLLADFKKILFNRNRLLKIIKEKRYIDSREMDIWDKLFIEKAHGIIQKRKEFIDVFNDYFNSAYISISQEKNPPRIKYIPSIESSDKGYIENCLILTRKRDTSSGITSKGPQRDDYSFIANDRLFNNHASQGQRRTASISLKIAENDIVEKVLCKECIILIDDIFSELDRARQKNMINFLTRNNQIFFTMVDKYYIDHFSNNESLCYTIDSHGNVSLHS